jgi:hypothetical protein
MKASHRLGVCSLFAFASAAAAACSSGGGSNVVGNNNDASTGPSDSGAPDGTGPGPVVDGSGAPCTPQSHVTMAVKMSLDATWPAQLAVSSGSDKLYIWLLSSYDIDSSNNITGTSITCKNQTPPVTLNSIGKGAVGAPSSGTAQVQIVIPPTTWDAINAKGNGVAHVSGQIGGWNIGSSLYIAPSTTTDGLSSTSSFANPATAWPQPDPNGNALATSDLADDDGDGKPGITAVPRSDSGFYVPFTAAQGGVPTDKLYIATRTEVALYGTSDTCATGHGTATVPELNNHVVGCEGIDPDGGKHDCAPAEYGFIDFSTTVYTITGGTFQTQQLTAGADGGAPTCADVLTALP